MEKKIEFFYENHPIQFKPSSEKNIMINATQMAKIFDKRVTKFMENEGTQNFIEAVLISVNNSPNSDYLEIKNKNDLIVSSQRTGTWMHKLLALKFAAWLDPLFEVWVFSTIEKLFTFKFINAIDGRREVLTDLKSFKAELKEVEIYLDEVTKNTVPEKYARREQLKEKIKSCNKSLSEMDGNIMSGQLTIFEQLS